MKPFGLISSARKVMACCLLAAAPVSAQENAPVADAVPVVDPLLAITQQFEIDRSDRMTVPVRINGSEPIPFIVDTGAERTVIANDLARMLRLEAGPLLRLATITGPTNAESFLIENLVMNTINVEMIEAPGLDRNHLGGHGLLGIDSLEDHKVLLDFVAQKMDVLASPRKSGRSRMEAGMIVVRAARKAGRMILSDAYIGGVRVDIILDTGAQTSMGNFALRDRMRKKDRRFDYKPVVMRSVTGDLLVGDFTQIRSITIGGVDMQDLPVTFADNYAFQALNLKNRPAILLGMDALGLFDRVLIDFTNRRVGFDLPHSTTKNRPRHVGLTY